MCGAGPYGDLLRGRGYDQGEGALPSEQGEGASVVQTLTIDDDR